MRARWFPGPEDLSGNPYWSTLASCLENLGVEFDSSPLPTGLGRRWLQENRGRVHVVHYHYVQPFYAYEATDAKLRWVIRFARNLVLARTLGYRTVFTLHNLKPTYTLKPAWVDYLGHWAVASLSSRVIVHSEVARRSLASRYGRRRHVHVIPHPSFVGAYENTISRDDARTSLDLAEHQMVWLFFGGIRPNKGLDLLVSTFTKLPGDNLRLLIVGKPWPPAEYLRDLQENSRADSRVRIIPEYIPDDQVQIYMNAADVVVLPFKEILSSSSAHLAMSFARPIVAPAMGELSELVSPEAGVLYDPADSEGLRQALLLCTRLDLETMGKRAFERVRPLTFDRFAGETLRVYGSD